MTDIQKQAIERTRQKCNLFLLEIAKELSKELSYPPSVVRILAYADVDSISVGQDSRGETAIIFENPDGFLTTGGDSMAGVTLAFQSLPEKWRRIFVEYMVEREGARDLEKITGTMEVPEPPTD
jgi:hypothetical protein